MKQLSLKLTLDEVNQVLEALGQQPYVKVHGLIEKIQQQGTGQLREEQSQAADIENDRPVVEDNSITAG